MRSPTADVHFSSYAGIQTDSAGVSKDADQLLTSEQIEWADIIFFMERKYLKRISGQFGKQLAFKKVICLGILDNYHFMQDELVRLLQAKIEPHILKTQSNDSLHEVELPAFNLSNASIRGGEVLISDSREWIELEDEHLASSHVIHNEGRHP